MAAGKQRTRQQHADQPAMKGHAPFPHIENVQRVAEVVRQPVEEHMAQPAADHGAQHPVEHQVFDVLAGEAVQRLAGLALRDAHAAQQQELREGHQIHQPIPANGQRTDLQGNGIELGMSEHVGEKKKAQPGAVAPHRAAVHQAAASCTQF